MPSSVSPSSYRNTIFNQSVRIFLRDVFQIHCIFGKLLSNERWLIVVDRDAQPCILYDITKTVRERVLYISPFSGKQLAFSGHL